MPRAPGATVAAVTYARPLIAILVLVVVLALGVQADGDLWWHIAAGREILESGPPHVDTWSYTAAGAPWIHHEWLYGAMLAWVFDHFGTAGLLSFRGLWLASTAGCMALAVHRRTQHALLTVGLVGLPLPFIAFLSNLRPQTATWALVPVAVALLDALWAGKRWAAPALVALVLVWVNLHGGFLFGWGLVGLGLLTSATGIDGERRGPWWPIVAVCVAPVLNAYGFDLIQYVATELTVGHPDLPEWNPPAGPMLGVVGVLILGTLGAVVAGRQPVERALLLGFLVASLASLRAAKFIQLLMLLAPILVAPQARRAYAFVIAQEGGEQVDRIARGVVPLVLSTLGLAGFASMLLPPPLQVTARGDVYPSTAIRWLAAQPQGHRLLVPLGWGGMARYHLKDWTVSMDGRNTTVYDPEWVQLHTNAMAEGQLEPLLRGDPEVALVRAGRPLDDALGEAGWTEAMRTPLAVVYTRVPLQDVAIPPAPETFP